MLQSSRHLLESELITDVGVAHRLRRAWQLEVAENQETSSSKYSHGSRVQHIVTAFGSHCDLCIEHQVINELYFHLVGPTVSVGLRCVWNHRLYF